MMRPACFPDRPVYHRHGKSWGVVDADGLWAFDGPHIVAFATRDETQSWIDDPSRLVLFRLDFRTAFTEPPCGHCGGSGRVPGLAANFGGGARADGDLIDCPACGGRGTA